MSQKMTWIQLCSASPRGPEKAQEVSGTWLPETPSVFAWALGGFRVYGFNENPKP